MSNTKRFVLSLGGVAAVGLALASFVSGSEVAGAVAPAAVAAEQTAAEAFNVDPVHSSVVYKIKHAGVAPFYGRFNNIAGTFTWSPGNPDEIRLDVAIDVNSVDTGNADRDKHLKSPDFFNVAEHPKITFTSKKVVKSGDMLKVTGDFTMHGVTKEITAELEAVGRHEGPHGTRAGYGGEFTIKRTDFGMDHSVQNRMLGDEVTIMFGIEGTKADSE